MRKGEINHLHKKHKSNNKHNKTNKDIAGKNDFMTFFIKPGQYFKLLK